MTITKPWIYFFFFICFLLIFFILILLWRLYASRDNFSDTLVYQTRFKNDVTTDFSNYDPCLKNYVHKGDNNYSISPSSLSIGFPQDKTSVSNTLYSRIGGQAYSWCQFPVKECCTSSKPCCPPVGNIQKGRFEYWVYFPPSDPSRKNEINPGGVECVFPFYKGGKLPGICSGRCPTGNSKTNTDYNNGWTLRLMFRQQGRLALLYSAPMTGMSLEPVPPELDHCFTAAPYSISTDQYWFCTMDRDYAVSGHRLAQYTVSPNAEDNVDAGQKKGCATPASWIMKDGIRKSSPITPVLQAGHWNFLRVQFNVTTRHVQIFHGLGGTDKTTIPLSPPTDVTIVLDTQPGAIPFTTSGPMTEVYWQPFFGGSDSSWYPGCYDNKGQMTSPDCAPTFVFGDFKVFSDWRV